ncbi:pyridoxamine 5'-phosphate oxidase family protein [Rhodocytophaga aerolata]|uniref:Pyridoxamine 5'-phosphate oxidase family protein n=1 Tax=Rhodocytophaga aerolata TaxID=455078 RepID=A0ABT8RIL6_9BACT|nr:pyridoxamine 5'-phosphate oxidase family protein [Rhodocytophaga aerolata]MDO1450522.1 pyridoxamine 5'-phosphate oxidase family protein [Rhodocytophaga aerolata]
MISSLFHHGELEMQQKTGEQMSAYRNGRIVVPYIVEGAATYIEQQTFVIVSSQDGQGRIWTSILSGEKGYMKVLDEKTLLLFPGLTHSNPADFFWHNIAHYPFTGMLFIEPATRRRYRVNGQVKVEKDRLLISVQQAYVNCPKYIQSRKVTGGKKPIYQDGITKGTALTGELMNWIKAADTFFVGSSNGGQELDASHRGGNPGFVDILNPSTLRIPDYRGNSMYNTLGNFLSYPQAGLLFIDFQAYRTLQLTGKASVTQENSLIKQREVTGRYWTLVIEEWALLDNISDTVWTFMDYSPYNPL